VENIFTNSHLVDEGRGYQLPEYFELKEYNSFMGVAL
jgi:hypothetical protein